MQVLNSFSSGRGPSTMSDPYSEGFRLMERSLREVLPDNERMAIESFTNSIRFFYRLIQNAEGL